MVSLYRDPKGEKIFGATEESQSQSYRMRSISSTLTTTITDESKNYHIAFHEIKNEHAL